MLNKEQIEAILPHREPFLFVDRVLEMVPGEYAIAEKDILPTDDVFRGHFPGRPVFPGVLQLEALAQTGAIAALSAPEYQGKLVLFGRADEVRFRRAVLPGDTLRLEARLVQKRGGVGKGEAKAYVGEELACSALLTFVITDP